jgi:hypothetical protein
MTAKVSDIEVGTSKVAIHTLFLINIQDVVHGLGNTPSVTV